jgi:asparagine synthase (glutamine-hydrolysing)
LPYSAYGKNWLRMVSLPSDLERYFEHNYAHYFLRRQLLEPEWMLPAENGFLIRKMGHCLLRPGGDSFAGASGSAGILSQVLYFEAVANLTGDMLVKVDRTSMANSLEVRCPLLDHRLAEEAARCPHGWKIRSGKGKQILIEAVRERLPAAVLDRPKQGFGVPLAKWMRGELRTLLWDHLTADCFRARGIARPEFVETLLREHDTGRRDNSHWLWWLLMMELWFRAQE